jgi:hypothetical protein
MYPYVKNEQVVLLLMIFWTFTFYRFLCFYIIKGVMTYYSYKNIFKY